MAKTLMSSILLATLSLGCTDVTEPEPDSTHLTRTNYDFGSNDVRDQSIDGTIRDSDLDAGTTTSPPEILYYYSVEPAFTKTYTLLKWKITSNIPYDVYLNGEKRRDTGSAWRIVEDRPIEYSLKAANAAGNTEKRLTITPYMTYSKRPNIDTCDEGSLSADAKNAALNHLNQIRASLELPLVTYDYSADIDTQKAALMTTANGMLDHFPPSTWICYSSEGYNGTGNSNLALTGSSSNWFSYSPQEALNQLLIDNNVPSISHRAWLLNPFLTSISIGISDGGGRLPISYTTSAVWISNWFRTDLPSYSLNFVAFPRGEILEHIGNGTHSFSVLMDKINLSQNNLTNISYASTRVSVFQTSSGMAAALPISPLKYFSSAGLPNMLIWWVPDLKRDVNYTVVVNDVRVQGIPRDYTYTFTLR